MECDQENNRGFFKISCFGAGYVGGPTMAVMANKCPGNTVLFV